MHTLYKKSVLALLIAASLSGCAHHRAVDRKIDQELQVQETVKPGPELANESRNLILESTDLTQEQKDKLVALHAKVSKELSGLRDEEGKLKIVLFKTLLDTKSDDEEIRHLRRRIVKLDEQRSKRTLSAIDEARAILGRQRLTDDRVYRAFNFDHFSMGNL